LLPLSASLSAASRFSGRYFFFREGEGEPEREGEKSRREKGGLTEEAGRGGKGDSEDSLCLCQRGALNGKMLSSTGYSLLLLQPQGFSFNSLPLLFIFRWNMELETVHVVFFAAVIICTVEVIFVCFFPST
jgi:hypothetical protein